MISEFAMNLESFQEVLLEQTKSEVIIGPYIMVVQTRFLPNHTDIVYGKVDHSWPTSKLPFCILAPFSLLQSSCLHVRL